MDMPVPDKPATVPPEAAIAIRRWRWAILAVGLLLPLSGSLLYVLIGLFPGGPIAHWVMGPDFEWKIRPIRSDEIRVAFVLAPLYFSVVDWPFLVLAIRARRYVMNQWPNRKAAYLSALGGLTGMTAVYLVGYYFLGQELAFGLLQQPPRGTGAGYILGLFCPLPGFIMAFLGIRLGASLGRISAR